MSKHWWSQYLATEGLEFITHSKYSFAAMLSSTLFISLVKLPSTCRLCSDSMPRGSSSLSGQQTQCEYHVAPCLCPQSLVKQLNYSRASDAYIFSISQCHCLFTAMSY